jgi:hypothetical protein
VGQVWTDGTQACAPGSPVTATTLDRPGAGRAQERPPASRIRPPARPPASPGPAISAPTSLLAASLAGRGEGAEQAEAAPEEATWTEAFPIARRAGAGATPPTDPRDAWIHGIARPGALVRGSLLDLQRLAGNAAVAAALGRASTARDREGSIEQRDRGLRGGPSLLLAGPVLQRGPNGAETLENVHLAERIARDLRTQLLREVQGMAMFALLPALTNLDSTVLADEEAARAAGGQRLIVAIRAVKQKGAWDAFATAHGAELTALPIDQIGDILTFVGAPKDVKVYDQKKFNGQFDALVDPVTAMITLILKVKAIPLPEAEGTPPSPAEIEQFKAGFKRTVEAAWSGKGTVKPSCPKIPTFKTRAVVNFVESGEHLPIKVYDATVNIAQVVCKRDPTTGKPTGECKGEMASDTGDKSRKTEQPAGQPDPKKPLTSEQVPAAHEFGHAIGIDHVRCKEGGICYGTTKQEFNDVMGGGMKLQRLTIGGAVHSDFAAFERIGKCWGEDIKLPAKCNVWGG